MKYDVLVAGGGFAGAAAAIAAARGGAKVLLVEKSGFLGGAAGNCYVNPFMGYTTRLEGKTLQLADGLFSEILRRLDEKGGLHRNRHTFSGEMLKLVLDEMTEQSGVQVLFHTQLTGVRREGRRILSVTAAGKGGEMTFSADCFIDATGDGDLAALAGCSFRVGREQDGLCQPMTLCFWIAGVEMEKVIQNGGAINELYRKAREEGRIRNPREDVLSFLHMADGVLHLNSTRVVKKSPLNAFDLSEAEREGRKQMYELYTFLKDNCEGFEHSVLLSSAPEIGVRESRMIDGLYTLTAGDLMDCVKFDDAVAACNYDIDIHNPEGSGTSHYYFADGSWYTIPYRCLIPRETDNLLTAGRCISGSHEAQASFRIMPTCCCTGEAAGTAAAVSLRLGTSFPETDVREIQAVLRKNGAFIGI
ncbi:MAG: FAD-dependent oxidoreductase [Oscillospiraceae bacterium]|nr:FAD-dependent oxidoreductase [Oscillospiraceae bacterium]